MNIKLACAVSILTILLVGCSSNPPQNRTNAAWDSGHCDALLKQMDELRRNPAQRTVILERYQMECQNKEVREGMRERR